MKRRLNKKHKEELDALLVETPQEEGGETPSQSQLAERRKARLEELYQQVGGEAGAGVRVCVRATAGNTFRRTPQVMTEYGVLAQRLGPRAS